MVRRCRLRWPSHVECNGNVDWVKTSAKLVTERTAPVGRAKTTWQNTVSADMHLQKVYPRDVHDQLKLRAIEWDNANPATSGIPP